MNQSEQNQRIDYVEFPATDMAGTKKFLSGVFGWSFTDFGPGYMSFEDGRLKGGFRAESSVVPGGPLVVIYAVDLESVERKVKAHGGPITKEIFSFPGGRRFHFQDPNGNELAVWSDR